MTESQASPLLHCMPLACPAGSEFVRIQKQLHRRTQGKTWRVLPETEEDGFAIVHVFGRHSCYYACLDDFAPRRNTDYIRLYEKVTS